MLTFEIWMNIFITDIFRTNRIRILTDFINWEDIIKICHSVFIKDHIGNNFVNLMFLLFEILTTNFTVRIL